MYFVSSLVLSTRQLIETFLLFVFFVSPRVNTEALSSSSDNSWQVRRAAFAVLSAFIRARGDLLQNHYHPLCLHLVSRFKERDVAVREDVLVCCTELVKQASIQEKEEIQQSPGRSTSSSASIDEDDDDALPNPLPSLRRTRSYEKVSHGQWRMSYSWNESHMLNLKRDWIFSHYRNFVFSC